MCNLYSLAKDQAAIRDWFRAKHDRTGHLPLFRFFPDPSVAPYSCPRGLDVRPLDAAKSASERIWHGGTVLPSGAIEVMAGERHD